MKAFASGLRMRVLSLTTLAGPFAVVTLVWSAVVWLARPSPDLLPSPWDVVGALADLSRKGMLGSYIAASLIRLLAAVGLALAVGIPAGLLIGASRRIADFVEPVLLYFQSLSGIAWLPLIIIWLGFNNTTVLVAVIYTVVFPVMFNTTLGVKVIPPLYLHAVRTLGGSWRHELVDVILPGALPSVLSGIRVGVGYGWRALIGSEMLVGVDGLGSAIFKAQTFQQTGGIIAGMVALGILWVLLDHCLLKPLEEVSIERWGLVHR